jgi:hypothetical protein
MNAHRYRSPWPGARERAAPAKVNALADAYVIADAYGAVDAHGVVGARAVIDACGVVAPLAMTALGAPPRHQSWRALTPSAL